MNLLIMENNLFEKLESCCRLTEGICLLIGAFVYLKSLPHHHKDPFDRLLIAQAITENLSIISTDHTLNLIR